MKKITLTLIGFLFITLSNANAWVHSGDVTIDEMIEWQDNYSIIFTLSNGTRCYVPSGEKNLYSLVLTIFSSGKKIDIHCHDSIEATGGINAHRVHRIVTHR